MYICIYVDIYVFMYFICIYICIYAYRDGKSSGARERRGSITCDEEDDFHAVCSELNYRQGSTSVTNVRAAVVSRYGYMYLYVYIFICICMYVHAYILVYIYEYMYA
jgi:hypothetical protein